MQHSPPHPSGKLGTDSSLFPRLETEEADARPAQPQRGFALSALDIYPRFSAGEHQGRESVALEIGDQ